MGFFDDENDPFEEIVKEFFGGSPSRIRRSNFISGEDEERAIDFIETKKKVFFVFELPGYSEEDIKINVEKGMIEILAQKKDIGRIQGYLSQKLGEGVYLKKKLPQYVNTKKFNFTFKNGILEVVFDKK